MPLVSHTELPTFARLREMGQEILTLDEALRQDIRELHVGLLNMMPDAALRITEQQFMRLVGNSNRIAQFYVHPFSIPGLPRSAETQAYIETYYTTFEQIQAEGLDALIITGANVANPSLDQEPFWEPLKEVIGWATEHVTSVLCSCLSTHALVKFLYGIERQRLPRKRWGVFPHRVAHKGHPLLRGINTRFDVVHSRYNEISRVHVEKAGLPILVDSERAGVHMLVSPDHFRIVYFQGHPEYDHNSLLKEFKREVLLFIAGERADYPPYPENYFSTEVLHRLDDYGRSLMRALKEGHTIPEFPEAEIDSHLDNTWGDTGKAIFNNWLGLVYRLTNLDRKRPFCDGVNPADPLGLVDKNKRMPASEA